MRAVISGFLHVVTWEKGMCPLSRSLVEGPGGRQNSVAEPRVRSAKVNLGAFIATFPRGSQPWRIDLLTEMLLGEGCGWLQRMKMPTSSFS
jgi:hypothetical protein